MWYYTSGGQKLGPVENTAFDDLVRTGVVRGDTLVWQQGMENWLPLSALRTGITRYGGFWIRLVARVIDSILVGVVSTILRIPLVLLIPTIVGLGSGEPSEEAMRALIPAIMGIVGFSVLIQVGLSLAYEVYFLSTRGATLGKMAVGLKVVTAEGGRISAVLATGRFFASILSSMTLFIGYIIAAFDDEKRTLHDHICKTRVIYAK